MEYIHKLIALHKMRSHLIQASTNNSNWIVAAAAHHSNFELCQPKNWRKKQHQLSDDRLQTNIECC